MSSVLSCSQLGVRFGDRWVFRHLDLAFHTGRTYAITGPSGAGKTTLLSALGGLITPDEGVVHTPDDQRDGRTVRPAISWLTQRANLLGRRSVLENVSLSALAAGCTRKEAESRARRTLEELHLAALADRETRSLSGGEAARAALARSLTARASFVLADEPTGNLDAVATSQMVDLLTRPDPERCVVVVTHDPRVADRCDEHIEVQAIEPTP